MSDATPEKALNVDKIEIGHVDLHVTPVPPPADPRPTTIWARLDRVLKTTLGGALLALLCTSILGGLVSAMFASASRKAQEREDALKSSETNRRTLIGTFTNVVASRRVSLGLVSSGIQFDAPMAEMQARWDKYQQDYRAYDVGDFTYKADLRDYLGKKASQPFEAILDHDISAGFRRSDACVTRAYRAYSKGDADGARSVLASCATSDARSIAWNVSSEINKLQGCFATYDNELIDAIYLQNRVDRSTSGHWLGAAWNSIRHSVWRLGGTPHCAASGDWDCKRDADQLCIMPLLRDACADLSDIRHKRNAKFKPFPPSPPACLGSL